MGENASDALKMAAAILLFVMALSVAIFAFSKARYSAEKVMENLDGTFLFYDTDNIYLDYISGGGKKTQKINIEKQAIIDKGQFIVNLFNYYTSGYTILFYYANIKKETSTEGLAIKINEDTIHKLTLYYSEAAPKSLNRSILRVDPTNYKLRTDGSADGAYVNDPNPESNKYRAIYGLDITDEISRQEPWIYNDAFINKFVEDLVMGYIDQDYDGTASPNLLKAESYTKSGKSDMNLNYFEEAKYRAKEDFTAASGRRYKEGDLFTLREYNALGADTSHCESSNDGSYKYWFKYAYKTNTHGKSFMEQDCRFIQRIGTYNYESSSTIQTSSTPASQEAMNELIENLISGGTIDGAKIGSLTDVDASEDLLSNLETIDNYGGTEKKIVQYIYIGETNIYD